jgi:hypothetical protein
MDGSALGRRATLGEIGHRLGRKALAEVATVARPDTILAWYRKLVAGKFDGSEARRGLGRPRITREIEKLIVRIAEENRSWGYDRIAGALANLEGKGNVLLFPRDANIRREPQPVQCRERLGGLLRYYHQEAA